MLRLSIPYNGGNAMKPEFLLLNHLMEPTYTLVHQIFLLDTKQEVYYPDILFKHSFPEKSISITDRENADKVRHLFKNLPPHKIHIFIRGKDNCGLSDYLHYREQIESIESINHLEHTAIEEILSPYIKSHRLTTTQVHQLCYESRLYLKRRTLYPQLPSLDELINTLPPIATILERNAQFHVLIKSLQCTEFFQSLY